MKNKSSKPPLQAALVMGALIASSLALARPYDCLIEPNKVVEIRSPVEGTIAKVNVERGGVAKKGQTIVELESDVERSNMEAAKFRAEMGGRINASQNRLDFAIKKLQRSQELYEEKFLSAQARDEAETEKRLAEAELKDAIENQELAKLEYRRAQDQLNMRMIRSPFDGYVIERLLNPGDLAESGNGRKPILKLAQINPLRVEVILPQDVYGRIKLASKVTIRPDGFDGKYSAQVTVVDKVIDAASGTFGIRLELANPKGALPSGIRCTVEFPDVNSSVSQPKK